MNLELAGKVGIVTGAGSGIGETIALEFGKEKTKVVICDIDLAAAQKVRDRIEGTGSDVLVAKTDVSKQADVNKMVEKTLEEFGKIDILVNNAGVTKGVGFLGMDEADWDRLFNVNVKGMFYCCRAVLPHMIRQQSGKIINISSQQGKRGVANLTGYCGTKFAAVGITQSLADEMAEYNINVNAVCPGIVRTPLWKSLLRDLAKKKCISEDDVWEEFVAPIPLKRATNPKDIANMVLFLSSDVSRNMTGQSVNVNGGTEIH